MKQLEIVQNTWQRTVAILLAAALLFTMSLQLFANQAGAAQLTARKVTMSTSAPSTASSYTVTFTPGTLAQELVIDFCSNSPLTSPGAVDSCSFAATSVPTVSSPSSSAASAGANGTATSVGSGTPVHTIKVTGLTMAAGSPYSLTLSGITNPTAKADFYARIITYTTGNATNYAPANTTGNTPTIGSGSVDYGGVALSATDNVTITSKVFETMSFCVYQTSCGTPANLTLGNSTTGALDISNAYVNSNALYTLATNAGSGASVTMTGTTLCRPGGTCTTGANAFTVSAVGSSAAAKTVGSEQFGMCVNKGGSAALTIPATYTDSVNACASASIPTGTYAGSSTFGFNDASTAGGTNHAAGSQILSSTGPVSTVSSNFGFLGDIAATTEAGIYSTSLNMVATGTF